VELRLISTKDGSHTLLVPELNETYHSTHGAIHESRHVFIEAGFLHISPGIDVTYVLEIGFGTGLNALLTQIEAETMGKSVLYTAIEAYPLDRETWSRLNYPRMLCSIDYTDVFKKINLAGWGKTKQISRFFNLHKIHRKLEDYSPPSESFDLVYFDAFSPTVQPELWTLEIFRKLYNAMKAGGILTTYSVKGDVTRALRAAGFMVEKIPGPPGKRQITRALKLS
jgi:tRNA U34 5-methylaminomethyl-2-thiouridine-forming methyltransferase MnmC